MIAFVVEPDGRNRWMVVYKKTESYVALNLTRPQAIIMAEKLNGILARELRDATNA